MIISHKGESFSGAVALEVSGKPEALGQLLLPLVPSWVQRSP